MHDYSSVCLAAGRRMSCSPRRLQWAHPESIERFVVDYAFLRQYDSAPRPPPYPPLSSPCFLCFSVFLCVAGRVYCQERGEPKHTRRKSLALYKSFNNLWAHQSLCYFPGSVAFLPSRLIILNHPFSFLPNKMVAESTNRLLLLVLNTFLVISVKGIYS